MKVLEMATIMGAAIIEKHFTHDKTLPGNDHYHAMDKIDLKLFHFNMKRTFVILGEQKKHPLISEIPARKNARRSLVATSLILKDEVITKEHLTWKRPAHGISPKNIEDVIGKIAIEDIPEDHLLQWDLISADKQKIEK
jgi:N-acetylneuraminate synthase